MIKEYYTTKYPDDLLGLEISSTATFDGLYDCLIENMNLYDYIGVMDSIIRERIFEGLAAHKNVDYDVIYYLWLEGV